MSKIGRPKKHVILKTSEHWWPLLFAALLALILLARVGLLSSTVKAVDECNELVPSCSYQEVTADEYEAEEYAVLGIKYTVQGHISYTYNVITWGAVTSDLNEFKTLANQTMNDSRGWTRAGVGFQEVDTEGDFTLVLSDAATLGTIYGCSSDWSCRSGPFVIINQERWEGATDAWNAVGGDLREYRHYVVNHELGHWLGHGHPPDSFACSTLTEAPVMLQQSISLRGCITNPWPLTDEIAAI